jgi:hypothetical protein
MGIEPAAILALISDLTTRLAAAESENAQLRQALAQKNEQTPA